MTENKESELSPATTIKIADYGTCLPARDIKAREINRWVTLDWDVPTADSVAGLIGFTIFRDEQRLKELWNTEAMVTYTDFSTHEVGKAYTYRIETLYSSGCVASDSVEITLTDEGTAMAPFGIRFNYKKNSASTEDNKLYDVTTTWESPMFEEPLAIGYGTGQLITGAGFDNDEINGYWACIGWDTTDLKLYKDLYLVGMEYMIGDNVNTFEAVVYLNENLAYTEPLRRTQAQAWQTMYFNKSISMNQPKEVVLGYHLTYSAGAAPVAIDFSYNKRFYSDIISFDGLSWYSLADNQLSASWCIRGLVVRKRDLDEATTDGVINYDLLEGKIMRLDEAMQTTLTPSSTPMLSQAPTKAPLTLQGFNLYRQRMDIDGQDEVQLNDGLLKTFSYTETEALPEGEYDYTVEAVYANATKSATASVTLDDVSTETGLDKLSLTLFPNPASDIVYVNGDFSDLQILDLGGRVLRRLSSTPQIEVGNLTPGTYFFRFADKDGRKATYK
ncbi:MAG: T9SS type A sorting domain-containing protein, partial [Bacteroidales bacterium]|nr:T9SS type A sorting domain-containing protein [Bacteroidales bacterium]